MGTCLGRELVRLGFLEKLISLSGLAPRGWWPLVEFWAEEGNLPHQCPLSPRTDPWHVLYGFLTVVSVASGCLSQAVPVTCPWSGSGQGGPGSHQCAGDSHLGPMDLYLLS